MSLAAKSKEVNAALEKVKATCKQRETELKTLEAKCVRFGGTIAKLHQENVLSRSKHEKSRWPSS